MLLHQEGLIDQVHLMLQVLQRQELQLDLVEQLIALVTWKDLILPQREQQELPQLL